MTVSDAALQQGMRPKVWLLYAFATTILWGVWGAFTGLSAERGFPETLVYCVWSLTMIPPALYALSRAGWQLDRDPRSVLHGLIIGSGLSDLSRDLAVAGRDHRDVLCPAARAHQHRGRGRHRARAAGAAVVRFLV
jgi:hypothetical protein